jgi:hypothetical protein
MADVRRKDFVAFATNGFIRRSACQFTERGIGIPYGIIGIDYAYTLRQIVSKIRCHGTGSIYIRKGSRAVLWALISHVPVIWYACFSGGKAGFRHKLLPADYLLRVSNGLMLIHKKGDVNNIIYDSKQKTKYDLFLLLL